MGTLTKTVIYASASIILLAVASAQLSTSQCGFVLDSERRNVISGITDNIAIQLKKYRSLSQSDICEMPVSQLKKSIFRLANPKPDHPQEALSQRYQQSLSDNGEFNNSNWLEAREQTKLMQQFRMNGAGINSSVWENLGPGNIGGRVRSIAFDPDDSTRIYIGAVAGGVWLTEDSGASWSPTDDFMANLSVSTLIFDPTDSQVIYAGTGEGTFNADQVRGQGIFRSSDKGQTWSHLESTANNFHFYWVNRLTSLSDGSRIFAATHTGIWASDDDGVSWTSVSSGRSNDINVHPTDDTKLVAGKWGSAYYSEDGGDTWLEATGLPSSGRVEIAYSKSNPDEVYVSIDSNSGEIYKSTDGGQTYSLVNTGDSYLGAQGWYDNALWVDPFDSNHIIVGGIDLWRSTDGGVTLTKISTWWRAPNSAHADHHFILEDPAYNGVDNKRVYFANDGGIYVAEDVTTALDNVGWQELNNQLSITQFYGMGVAPNGTIVAGTQDNGTLIYKGDTEGWTATFGGDGGFSAADPTDSNYLYGEYVYLQIHRSTNGGSFSSYIYDTAMTSDGPNFIAPFILDPNNENRLLGGARQLWVTDDAKATDPTWVSKKATIATSSPISAIAVANGNSDLAYVGHNDGSLFKSTDATAVTPTWTEIDDINLPQRYLMRIAIDPIDSNIVYASYGGYELNNLWRSSDGGATWENASGTSPSNIPAAPIRSIVVHPTRSNQLYVGTEVGVFTSENSGATWGLVNDGPANVSVDELVWDGDETLYAATHGRGIWRATLNETTPHTIIFDSRLDVDFSIELETAEKVITGIGVPVDVTIVDGEYSLGCNGTFTSEPGTAVNGDTICLRHTSANDFYTEVRTQVTIGSSTFDFLSRTIPDITPDAFEFVDTSNVELGSEQISNSITVTGISFEVGISVTNGEYSIGCSNDFTSASSFIALNETVCLRHTASSEHFVSVTTNLTLGDTTQSFTSTTLPDTTPDAFTFTPVEDVSISTEVTSNSINATGFQVAIPISVVNGEYSIGCSGTFTNLSGEISPDESVCVRHTSSEQYVTQNTTTLDINGVTADFVSTTEPDRTPDDFTFTSVSNAETSTLQVSESVTVSGVAVSVELSVSNGEYSLGCDGTFSTAVVQIDDGQSFCLRHTSSNSFSSSTTTNVTVGTYSTSFVSTTKAAPPPPPGSSSGGGGGLPPILLLSLILGALYRRASYRRV